MYILQLFHAREFATKNYCLLECKGIFFHYFNDLERLTTFNRNYRSDYFRQEK